MDQISRPKNEVNISYSSGTKEHEDLLNEIEKIKKETVEIPLIIGGKKIRSDEVVEIRCPHDHKLVLGKVHLASKDLLLKSVYAALDVHSYWSSLNWDQRVAIFRKAADLLSKKERIRHVAATLMNLSKNPFEAESDVTEFIDFLKYNAFFVQQIFTEGLDQENFEMNRLDWRPLEGFVLAISPFNFYALGGNLCTTSTMLGNVALWKPATNAAFVNYEIMKLLIQAGLPPGIINFVPFKSKNSEILLKHPDLAGLHFTGSYDTLVKLWMEISKNIPQYKNFPRIVGETGGKGFIFVHRSADVQHVVASIIKGGFGSQGQKCSAASRLYIPKILWSDVKKLLKDNLLKIKYGPVDDFQNFMGAMIDESAYNKVVSYIDYAKRNAEYEIIYGGTYSNDNGWFVGPTVFKTINPKGKLMSEEIFGPVVTVFVYDENKYEDTLKLCDATSMYGLTGSIFAKERNAIVDAERILRYSAGNFYINDKPTGSFVGRQPFGGARHSGTNDKTGLWLSLLRWLNPRSIKETTLPVYEWDREHMR